MVTCVCVDDYEELVWAGTASGFVRALTTQPALAPRCAFPCSPASSGGARRMAPDVLALRSVPTGVLALSGVEVSLHGRGGVRAFAIRPGLPSTGGKEAAQKRQQAQCALRCCDLLAPTSPVLATGDEGGSLVLTDLSTLQETGRAAIDKGFAALRATGRGALAAGSVEGELTLHDHRAKFAAAGRLRAHQGSVLDVAAQGDLIATVGLGKRAGQVTADAIKVFDVRAGRASPLSQLNFGVGGGPFRVAFVPTLTSTLLVGSQGGLFASADVRMPSPSFLTYQTDCAGAAMTCLAPAASGEMVALGDAGGYVHLWGESEESVANAYGRYNTDNEVPAAVPRDDVGRPIGPDDVLFTPIPGAGDGSSSLLSDIDAEGREPLAIRVGQPPRQLEPTIAAALKRAERAAGGGGTTGWTLGSADGGHLAPPPGLNGVGSGAPGARQQGAQAVPNPAWKGGMLPGEAAALAASVGMERRPGKGAWKGGKSKRAQLPALPRGLRRVEIKQKPGRGRFEEFDFASYNTTRFAGLENNLPNCYCHAILQTLFFIPELRAACMSRVSPHEFSLSDELGFLFHMFTLSNGAVCQAQNLLRALRQIREASALGLLEDNSNTSGRGEIGDVGSAAPPLRRRIANFTRFLLEQLQKEATATGAPPVVASLFGITVLSRTRAADGSCAGEQRKNLRSLCLELQYPSEQAVASGEASPGRASFCSLLASSMRQSTEMRAWFEPAGGYKQVRQERLVLGLPQVLHLNCAVRSSAEFRWWEEGVKSWQGEGGAGSSDKPWLPFFMRCDIEEGSDTVHIDSLSEREADMAAMELADEPDTYTFNTSYGTNSRSAVYKLAFLVVHVRPDDQLEEELETNKDLLGNHGGHLAAYVNVQPPYVETRGGFEKTPVVRATPGISPMHTPGYMHLQNRMREVQREAEQQQGAAPATPPRPGGGGGGGDESPRTPEPSKEGAESDWLLFNDFEITSVPATQVVALSGRQVVPCLAFYVRHAPPDEAARRAAAFATVPAPPITGAHFRALHCDDRPRGMGPLGRGPTFLPLNWASERPRPGLLLGIDAEFVAMTPPVKEILEDGSERVVVQSRLSLGRVSVVRGEGAYIGQCCIDDYVRSVEPVYDYLTRFSGLVHGDLDPTVSRHHVVTLKQAYMKLRYLIDQGCVLVGHGLKKDFRMINLVVPPSQVVDTVDLFYVKRSRRLSLRYLSQYLLRADIQGVTHDSIEDARTALALYQVYLQLVQRGVFNQVLRDIYTYGRAHGWEVDSSAPPPPIPDTPPPAPSLNLPDTL